MLTGSLKVEHFPLAIVKDLIGRFNLVQKRLHLGEGLTAGSVFRIGLNDAPRGTKFVSGSSSKQRIVLARLGEHFAVWLSSVQRTEPTFECKPSSQPEFIQLRHGLSKRHIEIRYNRKIFGCVRYLVQQKARKRDGEQQ